VHDAAHPKIEMLVVGVVVWLVVAVVVVVVKVVVCVVVVTVVVVASAGIGPPDSIARLGDSTRTVRITSTVPVADGDPDVPPVSRPTRKAPAKPATATAPRAVT
jgi:hypothetical protein